MRRAKVIPTFLLLLTLSFLGCSSDKQDAEVSANRPTAKNPSNSDDRTSIVNDPTATAPQDVISRNEDVNVSPLNAVELYGNNSIDTSVVLDDFEIAVWINTQKLLHSEIVDNFLGLTSDSRAPELSPLDRLEQDLGIDPSLIASALFLTEVPEVPAFTPSEQQGILAPPDPYVEPDAIESSADDIDLLKNEDGREASAAQDNKKPETTELSNQPAPSELRYGAVLTFTKAVDLSALVKTMTTSHDQAFIDDALVSNAIEGTKAEHIGNTYIVGAGEQPSVFIKDDKTMFVGSEEQLKAMIEGQGGNSDLALELGKINEANTFVVVTNIEEVPGALTQADMTGMGLVGSQLLSVIEIATKVETAVLAINPDADKPVFLQLSGWNEKDSQDIFLQLNSLATLAKVLLPPQLEQFQSNPNADQATLRVLEAGVELAKNLSVTNKNNSVTVQLTWNTTLRNQLMRIVTEAASSARVAADHSQNKNNLKQLGVAVYIYSDVYGSLPAGEKDSIEYQNGKPMLSWRVHLLPYLEHQALYEQFKLDEPWDSPHNIKLLDQMPTIYQHSDHKDLKNKTVYRIPAGAGSVLGGNKIVQLADITDNPSNTAMILAVGKDKATEWTKPEPLSIDMGNIVSSFGSLEETITVVLADGAVLDIPLSMENGDWLNFLDRRDGEDFELPR
ncbi:MAG: DUF1559 domain-containing protein [Planctomycetota bacterium]|nr:DUF1559 domain-containing protein [Planctomycetota bacterium]